MTVAHPSPEVAHEAVAVPEVAVPEVAVPEVAAPEIGTAQLDPAQIDAVVFDIGGVFVVRHHEAIREALLPAGFEPPEGPDAYHRAHHLAVRALSDVLRHAEVVHEYEREMWVNWERGYMRALGLPEDRIDEAAQAVMTAVTGTGVRFVWRQLLQQNIEAFHRIVASGLPVAVVSNNDGTAEEQLRHFGICQVGPGPLPSVRIVVDSGLVGITKPHPEIFAPALQALGTEAARTLYVGDTVHADVRGARAAGMQVVQLDPYDLHADFDHARLPDVAALAAILLP